VLAAGCPQQPWQFVADGQGDGGGPGRGAGPPGRLVRLAADREPAPGDAAVQAYLVQPLPAVSGHPGREHGLLPGPGGQLETLQLLHYGQHAAAALPPGVGGDVLPAQQEADEVAGRDRLDLAPLALPGVRVDAGQHPPGAPLFGSVRVGEPAAEREALVLQPDQGEVDVRNAQ